MTQDMRPTKIWICPSGERTYSLDEGNSTPELSFVRHDIAERLALALEGGPTAGPDFLEWIADRIVNVYGESDNVDFVLSLRQRALLARAALKQFREGV